MGHYKKGILGPFSGKVGTVIGATWKGRDYMRSLPKAYTGTPTNNQMIQRVKFALAINFLKPISSLVNLGFKEVSSKITGYNAAMADFVKNAITGTYPDFSIEYSKVLISRGSLTDAWNATIESTEPEKVVFKWTDNSSAGTAKANDQAILLLYNPEQSKYIFHTDGGLRSAGTGTVAVPLDFSGDTVEAWIAFRSADGESVSTSMYAGTVRVA